MDFNQIIAFHGHLGPYLVLGYRAGEEAIRLIGAQKHFGVKVEVACPDLPPPRCFIDGLQLSTGATFGKANISQTTAPEIMAKISNKKTGQTVTVELTDYMKSLFKPRTHEELDVFAREVAAMPLEQILSIKSE